MTRFALGKTVMIGAMALAPMMVSGCGRTAGNEEIEPLPADMQARVINSSTSTSRERLVERGVNQTDFDPAPVEPNPDPDAAAQ